MISCGKGSTSNVQNSIAYCPAGYTLTGGGYQMVHWEPQWEFEYSHSNAPDASYPGSTASWVVWAGGAPGASCFRSFAVCMK